MSDKSTPEPWTRGDTRMILLMISMCLGFFLFVWTGVGVPPPRPPTGCDTFRLKTDYMGWLRWRNGWECTRDAG